MWSKKNTGLLEAEFTGIPLLLFISKSKIYNEEGENRQEVGALYTLHITPFLAIGFVKPTFTYRK